MRNNKVEEKSDCQRGYKCLGSLAGMKEGEVNNALTQFKVEILTFYRKLLVSKIFIGPPLLLFMYIAHVLYKLHKYFRSYHSDQPFSRIDVSENQLLSDLLGEGLCLT